MMETKTAPYDVADFLETPEEMAAYLEACIQESDGDAAFIAKALGDIARAKGTGLPKSVIRSSSPGWSRRQGQASLGCRRPTPEAPAGWSGSHRA